MHKASDIRQNLYKRIQEKTLQLVVYDLDSGDSEPQYALIPANAKKFAGSDPQTDQTCTAAPAQSV